MADIPHLFILLLVTIVLASSNFFFNMVPMFMPKTKADWYLCITLVHMGTTRSLNF